MGFNLPNAPFNSQILQDANYIVTSSVTAASPSMDLIQASPFPTTRYVVLNVTASAVNSTKYATWSASLSVQDSADNSTFADVAAMGPLAINDAATKTAGTSKISYQFPPTIRRYVRVGAISAISASAAIAELTGSVTASLGF